MSVALETHPVVPNGTTGPAAADSTRLKVLIADDDLTNRTVLQAMLTKDGHLVWTARDGQEALDVFLRETARCGVDGREDA